MIAIFMDFIKKRTQVSWVAALVGLALIAAVGNWGCGDETGRTAPPEPQIIFHSPGGEAALKVEVARSPGEKSRGLMGRTGLEPDRGMIFVYDDPVETGFWMKDTLIPLSIAFISAEGMIVDIQDMDPMTLEVHYPAAPYVYAVEANRGFFERNGVRRDDTSTLALP